MKEFIFNSNGVALNPNKYQSTPTYQILTAQLPNGKWTSGHEYYISGKFWEGGSSPVSVNSKQFDSEKEAAFYELRYMRNRFLVRRKYLSPAQQNELDQLQNLITDHFCQLKLFEFE